MSAQLVLTADNHLDPVAAGFGPNRMRRREDHLRCFEEVAEFALMERPDLLLIGGDLFDSVKPSNATRAAVMRIIKSLHEAGIRVLAVGGHHDTPKSVEEGASPLAVYGDSGHMRFFKDPMPEAESLDIDGLAVSVIGLGHNPLLGPGQDPLSGLDLRPGGQVNILLMHYPIQGFGGWVGEEPIVSPSSIPRAFQLVASGHFHNHQSKRIGGVEAIYPGSTERVSFAEEAEEKGFVWLELGRDGVASKEFLRTSARPYRTVEVDFPSSGDPMERIKGEIEGALDPEAVLRVKLKGRVAAEALASYRRPEILSFCQGRAFHCFVDEGDLEILSPEAPEPLPRTTPLQELERCFRALMGAAGPEERPILEEALALSRARLQEAGAW
ncbi:MAG: DNA repair exonuclease [Candidatus Bathyarchaeia archaeon]